MAERRRTRRTAVGERPPAGRQHGTDAPRRASPRRPVDSEPEPAEDELEAADEESEPEPAEDELEVPEDELEVPEDELDVSEDDEEVPEDDEEVPEDDDEQDETAAEPAVNGGRRARGKTDRALSARQAARAALRQIAELTTKQPEEITGVQRTDDGWAICFEVVEDHRIPSSSDILATYEATIDAEGELVSYLRVRRYARGRGDRPEGQ